jgi:hypothetical protein
MGAPMLTSGRKMSCARRERPMAMPMTTPMLPAMAKPVRSRNTVSSAWRGRMPERVSWTKAEAMVSSGGNRRAGKTPRWATISHNPPTTRNGKTLPATFFAASPRSPRAAGRRDGASTVAADPAMSDTFPP